MFFCSLVTYTCILQLDVSRQEYLLIFIYLFIYLYIYLCVYVFNYAFSCTCLYGTEL
jgi:hypothetical protein